MQEVPAWLEEYSKTSMPGAGYADVGAKFGGRDIRKNQPRVGTTSLEGNNFQFFCSYKVLVIGNYASYNNSN